MERLTDHSIVVVLTLIMLAPALPLLFIGAIIVVMVRSGSRAPIALDPRVPITLHAHLTRGGAGALRTQFDAATYGSVSLDATYLYWAPDQGERWRIPITSITVLAATGFWGLSAPHVDLLIEGSGTWRLVVSDQRINRLARNDAKRAAEARRGAEFRDRLLAAGARAG